MVIFHDYIMIVLVFILVFSMSVFSSVISSPFSDHQLVDSHSLEFVWTVFPMVFLVFMALPSLYLLYLTEDISACSLVVKVIAHQWYWEYEYYNSLLSFNSYMQPDGESSGRLLNVDNRLALPTGVSTIVIVTSADVLHSWTVPSLGVNVDAIPGRLNLLNVTPSYSGLFYGQCSELCGVNHSFMPIAVEIGSLSGMCAVISE